MMVMFGSTYTFEQFFSHVYNNKTKKQARLTDERLKSIMTVVSNYISLRIEILSWSK